MTKFLADENVPLKAVKALKRKGLDIVSVIELSPGLKDKEVLNLAKQRRENHSDIRQGLRGASGQATGQGEGANLAEIHT